MTSSEPLQLEQPARRIRISSVPHMPAEPLSLLSQKLASCHCFLEYGAGGSTRLAVQSGVKAIYSVESDPDFADAVKKQISRDIRRLEDPTSRHFRIFVPRIGPTERWGFPASKEMADQWPSYPLKIWDYIEKDENAPDLILIDGRFRLACFLLSLLKSKVGTTILFDDYLERGNRYITAERYISPIRIVGRMAEFIVPTTLDYRSIAIDLLKASMRPG